jgi:hypothetical protein
MKDFLSDIVSHTQPVGIDLIKVIGDDKETTIKSKDANNNVILSAKFNNVNQAFIGTFGMPDLSKLNVILNIPEYAENAKINVVTQSRNGTDVPVGLHFENAVGDFKNEYRFMAQEIINEKLKTVKFGGAAWNITFEPTVSSINRLKFMASANREVENFVAKTENGNLKFYFGDPSTHAGNFVFQSGVKGTLTKNLSWNVGLLQSILNLQGDKTIDFSDAGVARITVNSGLITYEYLLPAKVS